MNRVTPVIMGATTAALAVAAQAFLSLQPPPAYGFCVVCHGRDLMIWLTSLLTGGQMNVAAVSANWPLLTVVGLFWGSRYAAVSHGEYNRQWVGSAARAFLCGLGVMVLGLMIMGCPARLLLRTAYGDAIGAAGIAAVLAGTAAATALMRWRARRC